jgi:predicted GIY-YIG superfamily endonuclease
MKNISIFLPFNDKDVKIAELNRANVKATSFYRDFIKNLNQYKEQDLSEYLLDHINGVGVYLLINEEDEINPSIYIGQTENCLKRINEHNKNSEKDFNKIIIFTSIKNDYTGSHVKYLEYQLIQLAKQFKRCLLINKIETSIPAITPQIKADLAVDIESLNVLSEILGVKVFRSPLNFNKYQNIGENQNKTNNILEDENIFIFENKKQKSFGLYKDGKFIILKDSYMAKKVADSLSKYLPHVVDIRNHLIENQIVVLDTQEQLDKYIFLTDYEFPSINSASACILGYQTGSKASLLWKNKYDLTLESYLEK